MDLAATARQLSKPYRVDDGKSFRLRDVDPADTASFESGKNWTFRARDVAEQRHPNAYPRASEDAIREGTAAQRRELAAALARG